MRQCPYDFSPFFPSGRRPERLSRRNDPPSGTSPWGSCETDLLAPLTPPFLLAGRLVRVCGRRLRTWSLRGDQGCDLSMTDGSFLYCDALLATRDLGLDYQL